MSDYGAGEDRKNSYYLNVTIVAFIVQIDEFPSSACKGKEENGLFRSLRKGWFRKVNKGKMMV